MDQQEMSYDVVVIGAGVMGRSAAYQSAQSGKRTLLVEQFPLNHSRGSSGGHSRITRLADYGSQAKINMMRDSFHEWQQIEKLTGTHLINHNTLISVGGVGNDLVNQMIESSLNGGGRARKISIDKTNKEYRCTFPPTNEAAEDPDAGVMLADKCLSALLTLFTQYGGTVFDAWKVDSIIPSANKIQIISSKGTVIASKLIICGGPWAGKLLEPLGIRLPLRAEKIGVFYWRMKEKFPPLLFIEDTPEGHIYGLPDYEYPSLVKIVYHSGCWIDADNRDAGNIDHIRTFMMQYIKSRFPLLESTPAIEETCIYTMTPDKEMIVDYHPINRNIVYAAGFSGTGFKMAPSIGKLLLAMCNDEDIPYESFDYRATRFYDVHNFKNKL